MLKTTKDYSEQLNQLAAKVGEGDYSALGTVIDMISPRLEAYLIRLGVKRDSIDDILQNTYIKIYTNINSFTLEKGSFNNWAYRINHNEMVNFFKKEKAIVPDNEEWAENITSDNDIAESIDRDMAKSKIINLISKLNIKYREPIILNLVENKSYEEISFILKIPISTVGVRIKRGKDKLKKDLENWRNY